MITISEANDLADKAVSLSKVDNPSELNLSEILEIFPTLAREFRYMVSWRPTRESMRHTYVSAGINSHMPHAMDVIKQIQSFVNFHGIDSKLEIPDWKIAEHLAINIIKDLQYEQNPVTNWKEGGGE